MKKILLSLLFTLASLSINALELGGTHIMSYVNNEIYQYATLTISVDGNNVTINNMFRRNKSINGTYDEIASTITIPAGQLIIETSEGNKYYLYSYTVDANNHRTLDKTSDIVFTISEGKTYNTYKTEQNLVAITEDQSSYASFTNVSYRNYQNAVLTSEVLDYDNPGTSLGSEEYPVYINMVGEGKYLVRNFNQQARLYIYTHRDGTISTEYGDYPIAHSSSLKNYYYAAAVAASGSMYSFLSDLSLYGNITDDKTLSFSSTWMPRCNNVNNTDVDESLRKVYSAGSPRRNMVVTLNSGRFNLPHVAYEASSNEVVLLTKQNFLTNNEAGWMWSGDTSDDSNATAITNKKSTIQPGTDATISLTTFEGLNLKYNNETKTIYMRVKGLTGLKYYVTGNGNNTDVRTAVVTLTPSEGESVTRQLESTSTGAFDKVEGLDTEKTYDIMFSTDEKDMTLYAVQFITNTTGITDTQETSRSKVSATYDLQGRSVNGSHQYGVNIQKMSDGTTKKVVK